MNVSLRNFKNKHAHKGQAGFTLMEIIFAITIIGAATILIISSYNNTSDTEDAQEEVQNINALSASIKHMFKTQGDYDGLENYVIMQDVSFPEQMRVSDSNTTSIRSAWSDEGYDVAPEGSDNSQFTITMSEVPQGACTSIVSKTYRHFESVEVSGSAVDGVASAASACSDVDSNEIVFTDS